MKFYVNPNKAHFKDLKTKPWDYWLSESEMRALEIRNKWQQLVEAGGKEGAMAAALLKLTEKKG